jgi:tetratricopeptide (TPR) repeat protein
MNTVKLLILFPVMLVCATLNAQTQEGYVKTLGRPSQKGMPLSGVSVRVKGEHNPVLSKEDGTFAILNVGTKNSEAYSLQEVTKNGYELNEPDIIGRQFAFSEKVKLTLVMVSSAQLQADKQRIENNAYRVAEKNYKARLAVLEKEKEKNALAADEYHRRLEDLHDGFERYQLLIEGLAEHYAHVDYDLLDEKEQEINTCIENGELERADSLIKVLFDPITTLKRNKDALSRLNEQITEANQVIDKANEDMSAVLRQQEKDAEYLYQLYTIALSRFDKEKAKLYIVTRAELDTTNVNWQTEAGTFLNNFFDSKQAFVYSKRAFGCALEQNGRYDYNTARSLSNLISCIDDDDTKYEYIKDAFEIVDSIGAHYFTKVRNSLYVSLGTIAHSIKDDSLALMAFNAAKENIEERFPDSEMLYTIYNNLGVVSRSLKDYDAALEYHKKALDIALSRYQNNHYKVGWANGRLGETLIFMKRYQEAQTYLKKALESVQIMYGDSHRKTQELYLSLGMASYVIHDWQNVYSSLVKIIPEQQRSLKDEILDSTEYRKALLHSELILSVTMKAMDSLKITEGKVEYLHQLYDAKYSLNKYDVEMYDVANRLGIHYYDKDSISEARKYFTTAFKALRKSGNKSYRRNSICHNLYYTYMDLLSTSDSLKYEEEYMKKFEPNIDITLLIDDGDTPASKVGMRGRYHLLKYEDWDYKSFFNVFDYNRTLIGKSKHITVEKDGVIQSFYFENKIGSTIEIKYIDAEDKAAIIEKYETQKQSNYEK